jgi:hypothetical protein
MAIEKLKRSLNISFLTDPYLAVLMKRMYLKNIKGEVDELNIQINGQNLEVIEFIRELWKDEATNIIWKVNKPETVNHGEALNELYKLSTGDIFIILDSDNFIYKKGIIDRYCSMINDHADFFDYVGSTHPYMSFFRKSMLDEIEVDFREEHKDGRFHDTMENMLPKISEIKVKIIPVDKEKEYEHIGRMSAFGIYAEECYLGIDAGLYRYVWKLFGRANRVGLIKHIYEITKKDVPLEKYNESYWKTFLETCEDIGHKQENIDKIIEETIKPKLKDYEQ